MHFSFRHACLIRCPSHSSSDTLNNRGWGVI
jgi:hypothetical protein